MVNIVEQPRNLIFADYVLPIFDYTKELGNYKEEIFRTELALVSLSAHPVLFYWEGESRWQ